jgi:cytochrome c oxidase assembly factor CtaG
VTGQQQPTAYTGRRDRRFVTVRRGGLLDEQAHGALVLWAAACAEHVLGLFEAGSGDDRPRAAIESARQWARGEISMTSARTAAYAAHAAARERDGAARAAARASGHAAATAHMADHELGPAYYALLAVSAATADPLAVERERQWQLRQLGPQIRALVLDDMCQRAAKFADAFKDDVAGGS